MEENVKNVTKNSKKKFKLILTTQIQQGSLCLGNIRCQEGFANKCSGRFHCPQIFHNEDSTQRPPANT